ICKPISPAPVLASPNPGVCGHAGEVRESNMLPIKQENALRGRGALESDSRDGGNNLSGGGVTPRRRPQEALPPVQSLLTPTGEMIEHVKAIAEYANESGYSKMRVLKQLKRFGITKGAKHAKKKTQNRKTKPAADTTHSVV